MKKIDLKTLLTPPKTIAIVGLSDKPERPSYCVAKYLLSLGLTIIPVNPNITDFNGIKAYPFLNAVPISVQIDIVDIFRKSSEVLAIVQEVIASGRQSVIWMQEDVESFEAKQLAQSHGLFVVMNTCLMKTHQQL